MKSFVAASCCLIVGLEILIGVPVAICVGFLCFGSDFSGTYVAEAQYPPMYAPANYNPAPPPLPSPLNCAVPGPPLPSFDPYAAGPQPTLCPAPQSAPSANTDSSEPTLPSTATAPTVASGSSYGNPEIADAFDSVTGSHVDFPAPTGNIAAASEEPQPPLAAEPAIRVSVGDIHQFLARVCTGDDCAVKASEGGVAGDTSETALLKSMEQTALLLYQQADRHEAESAYDLADHLRNLARDLRTEAGSVSRRLREEREEQESREPVSVPELTERPSGVTVGPPPLG